MTAAFALRPVGVEDTPLLERLWQLYAHDMSEFRGSYPGAEGLFKPGRFPSYFGTSDCCGYLLTVDEGPAGFAFVNGLDGDTRMIGDFFVVRAARRRRLGHTAAREVLARHRGRWRIGFQVENPAAAAFWRRVATDLVGDAWHEELQPVPNKPHIPDDHVISFTL